jgi:hypothetical protein
MMNFTDRKGEKLALIEWAQLYESNDYRRVKRDEVPDQAGLTVAVSTIWEGFSVGPEHLPYETMILGGKFDRSTWKWADENQALEGHKRILESLQARRDPHDEVEA